VIVNMLAFLLALAASQRADSQRVLGFARDAQADFETTRRHNLPRDWGHSGGDCDERIGRFCFWFGVDATAPPPEEPRRIGEARDRVVHQLDSTAALLPGDEWIAGQRVRYLVEAGRTADARAAARACRAAAWWCEVLAEFALHAAGDFAGADSAYRAALSDMPRDERCRWTDLSLLLEGELRQRYRRLACEERAGFEERLWWLAQPLYSVPGNDRRTEHFARATMSRIAEGSRTAYGVPWGDDLREITLRYGWPAYWTQQPPSASAPLEVVVTGHNAPQAVHFLPAAGALGDLEAATADAWAPDARRPRELYAPVYAASLARLEHQVALFRHGDSCLAVAAYDVGRDTLFAGASPDAALVLARDERTAPVIERRAAAGASDVIVAKVECRPLLFSLEVLARAKRHAARVRYGVRPPLPPPGGGVAVSDILLFDPADSLPTDLAAVLASVRGSATARSGARLGLFWEMYGLDPSGEPVTTSVTVAPARAAWLRRAAQSLGLARGRATVRLQWAEVPQPRGFVAGRGLAIDVSGLARGRYLIAVQVATGRSEAVATRELEVVGP
jgi:hypothetical protein